MPLAWAIPAPILTAFAAISHGMRPRIGAAWNAAHLDARMLDDLAFGAARRADVEEVERLAAGSSSRDSADAMLRAG